MPVNVVLHLGVVGVVQNKHDGLVTLVLVRLHDGQDIGSLLQDLRFEQKNRLFQATHLWFIPEFLFLCF